MIKLADKRGAVVSDSDRTPEGINACGMVDTVKLRRPDLRGLKKNGPSGRVEHDSRGNAFWKRTRASDSVAPPDIPDLALVEEPRSSADTKRKPFPKKIQK